MARTVSWVAGLLLVVALGTGSYFTFPWRLESERGLPFDDYFATPAISLLRMGSALIDGVLAVKVLGRLVRGARGESMGARFLVLLALAALAPFAEMAAAARFFHGPNMDKFAWRALANYGPVGAAAIAALGMAYWAASRRARRAA